MLLGGGELSHGLGKSLWCLKHHGLPHKVIILRLKFC